MAKETKDTPAKKTAPRRHRMIVGRQPIHEDGRFCAPGSEVELSAARAKALGNLVSPAKGDSRESSEE